MKKVLEKLTILLLLIFPFGQLTRTPLPWPEVSLYLHDLIILTGLIMFFLKRPDLSFFKKYKYLWGCSLISLFALVLSLSSLGFVSILISSLYLFRFLTYTLFFLILKQQDFKFNFKPYFKILILISVIFGFAQYFFFPSFEPLFAAGWDRHNFRLAGTWLDTGFAGLLFAIFCLYLLKEVENKKHLFWDLSLLVMSLLCLLLTYSRASFFAFWVGLVVYFMWQKRVKLPLFLIILFLVSIVFLPQKFGEGTNLLRTSTIYSRLGSWQEGWNLFLQKPIWGHGFNSLRYVKKAQGILDERWQQTHAGAGVENSFLFLLATTGIVGAGFFFKFIKSILAKNYLLYASFAAIFTHGMFANSWFYVWVILWIYLLIATKEYN
jgi:O-antigen ligase